MCDSQDWLLEESVLYKSDSVGYVGKQGTWTSKKLKFLLIMLTKKIC